MREIDFLPDWYPRARGRRRFLHLQGWSTLVLAGGLALWLLLAHRNISDAQAANTVANAQLAQSKLELKQLDEQLVLKKQLEVQRQIVSTLGLPVEMSRVINTLDASMPKEMSLLSLSITTEPAPVPATEKRADKAEKADKDAVPERILKIKLTGATPSDVDVANFMAAINNVPFFDDIHMSKSEDKSRNGHLMRQFEVTFSMSLKALAEEK